MANNPVTVIGAGLAGSEAAWQLANRGVPVTLVDMKPLKFSPAHHMETCAELVCANSLKAEHLANGSGLLKAEMKKLNSLILAAAEKSRVPAGAALAVDRDKFSEEVTRRLAAHPLIAMEHRLVTALPDAPCIVATGPLTDPALTDALTALPHLSSLHFFDAAAPIVTAESIDMNRAFRASRYEKGSDYLNCPMTREEYDAFYEALISAELAEVHDFEKKLVFEGCLAVEILAGRGHDTLAFGPLKPVGLTDPHTGKRPYAVVQLRQENETATLYNLVGFQTRLKWGEQKRVFRMIPGLERAEFARYGVMHKNAYLNGPEALVRNYAWKENPLVRFAGQFSGVEGYVESAASGMVAAIGLAQALSGREETDFTGQTLLGALARHVSTPTPNFQPMNANFGILDPMEKRIKGKKERYEAMSARSLAVMDKLIQGM